LWAAALKTLGKDARPKVRVSGVSAIFWRQLPQGLQLVDRSLLRKFSLQRQDLTVLIFNQRHGMIR